VKLPAVMARAGGCERTVWMRLVGEVMMERESTGRVLEERRSQHQTFNGLRWSRVREHGDGFSWGAAEQKGILPLRA
jgi:hypothetical protein